MADQGEKEKRRGESKSKSRTDGALVHAAELDLQSTPHGSAAPLLAEGGRREGGGGELHAREIGRAHV